MSGVVRRAALALVALVALVAVAAGVAGTCFGAGFLVFRSGSMAPAISTGSLALAVPAPVSQLQPGDVVSVVDSSGQRVTHRLVSATPRDGTTSLVLRGDADPTSDPETYPVPATADVDRVVATVPAAGYVVAHAVTPPGLVAGGAVLLMLAVGLGGGGGRRRAGVALVAALAVVGAGVGVAQTSGTWAYFTDTATYQSGTFTAGTVAPPTNVACTGSGSTTAFTWTAAPGATGYSVTYTGSGLLGNSGTTFIQTGTSWRPNGQFLGARYQLSVAAVYGTWTSSSVSSRNSLNIGLFGGYSCV